MRHRRSLSIASTWLALLALGGCCNQVDATRCFNGDQTSTCPDTEFARKTLDVDAVKSPGTLWPAHDYLVEGTVTTAPAACCYEVTATICSKDLR